MNLIYTLRDNAKLILKYLMRFVLKIYWIFPIKKNTIFFMANMGKGYLCNPKYIYKSIIEDEQFCNYRYVWCFQNPDDIDKSDFSLNTKIINKNHYFKYFYYLLTSEIIVYNCGGFSYAPIRKKQLLIETWHGGGAFKRVGLAVSDKSSSSKMGIKLAMKDVKLFLSSCEIATETLIKEAMGYKGEILNSGFPRNDLLFKDNSDLKCKIREKIGVSDSDHIILYAPTFRGDEGNAKSFNDKFEILNPLLIKSAFERKYGGHWKFYTRGHQYTNNAYLDGSDGDLSKYPDMQELLLISDVLITDYSSSIWDFSLTNKKCFLFVPDCVEYESKERGFLVPIDDWPGIKVVSNNDFAEKIMSYSEDEVIKKNSRYFNSSKSYEHGDACEKVKNYILDKKGR